MVLESGAWMKMMFKYWVLGFQVGEDFREEDIFV